MPRRWACGITSVRVTGAPRPASDSTGFDAAHDVSRVRLEDLSFNGRPVTTLEEAAVQIGPYVSDVTLK